MKFKLNQKIYIIYFKKILKGTIIDTQKSAGTYTIDDIENYPFTDLQRGAEAIFETEAEAQTYLETIK